MIQTDQPTCFPPEVAADALITKEKNDTLMLPVAGCNAYSSHYVVDYFDNADAPEWQNFCQQKADGIHVDMQGYNAEICRQAGVEPQNIHTSPINTVTSPDYFSHSAGDTTGRFVVVATLR